MKLSMGRARIIRGVLEELAELAAAPAGLVSRAREAIALLKPRIRKVLPFNAGRPAPAMTTSQIREACRARSKGCCEACGNPFTALNPAELDHFLGGSGRRKQKESVQTCWLLHRSCHGDKTHNRPSLVHWNVVFAAHCQRHGYPVVQRIERLRMGGTG